METDCVTKQPLVVYQACPVAYVQRLRSTGSCPWNGSQEKLRNEDQASECRRRGIGRGSYGQCRGVLPHVVRRPIQGA